MGPKSKAKVEASGLNIAKKVPIPWQSFSRFHYGSLLGVIKKNEKEVVEKGVCAYCGLGFLTNQKSIVWTNYPDIKALKLGGRVFSDHFPFHLKCMKEVRSFCPFMKLTKDEEFKVGLYQELLLESKNYLKVNPV